MSRIIVIVFLLAAVTGCYPPSYYDKWNRGSVERYLESYDYYPGEYIYYRPYYSWYPYFYFPFSLSLSYSYFSHDGHFYKYPYHGHHDRGRPNYHLKYKGRR